MTKEQWAAVEQKILNYPYGRRWIACPDCVMIAGCSIGQRVLAGSDEEYGCCAGALAPGKKMKGESEYGGF